MRDATVIIYTLFNPLGSVGILHDFPFDRKTKFSLLCQEILMNTSNPFRQLYSLNLLQTGPHFGRTRRFKCGSITINWSYIFHQFSIESQLNWPELWIECKIHSPSEVLEQHY